MTSRSPILRVALRMARVAPRRYVGGASLWVVVLVLPILTGVILKGLFDQISGHRAAGFDVAIWLCVAFIGVEVARGLVLWLAISVWPYWWNAAQTTLRVNALRSILTARGSAANRIPHSSGEAVSRFRDDVRDIVQVADNAVDLFAAVIFTAVAVAIMSTINPLITVVLAGPLVAILILNRALSELVRRVHRRARELGAMVTAHIGETFNGVLAIKTAGAEEAVLERLRDLNRRRRRAAVKDRLAMDMIDTATSVTVDLSIGLVLLMSAGAMRQGEFTVGDFALFSSYAGWLMMLPRVLGRMLYRVPQGSVAVGRLTRLMADHETDDDLSRLSGVWFREEPPPSLDRAPSHNDPLALLEVKGMTVRHDGSDRGVHNVDLRIRRGSFTVVTGAVGAGKTTLVRALLGLLPAAEGTVWWNGEQVEDPGTFLVPGRVAYAGQVPRLFSESLRENILLGWSVGSTELQDALGLAALDSDLAEMSDGLDTVVGPRGVRLSGGQVQRATAARALVRSPDLLVVDDLSSALDAITEQSLWNRIADAAKSGRGPETLLVVSHRRAVLERADQIVVLDRGAVAGCGSLPELIDNCSEMRRLWRVDAIDDAEVLPRDTIH
ncbi:ABC transporter ATP-binding protein [Microlunatus speluncae]|uniref:ABC transporter ATP-binding protein n=1 Tax=Microlunatus speluncae TaxID=2594267 RepID=UPI0012662682|nr:ABC transporter ATP-binding protein [Microlunatus speluncae]